MKKSIFVVCTLAIQLLAACTGDTTPESIPLPEHPRPDFERAEWKNLNGYWAFTFDSTAAAKALTEAKVMRVTICFAIFM